MLKSRRQLEYVVVRFLVRLKADQTQFTHVNDGCKERD